MRPDATHVREVSVPFRGFRGLQEYPALTAEAYLLLFQSPSGVLGVCREEVFALWAVDTRVVSVPFRGFRGLQAEPSGSDKWLLANVSVPFRGFRGLQGASPQRSHVCLAHGFSPLPGF